MGAAILLDFGRIWTDLWRSPTRSSFAFQGEGSAQSARGERTVAELGRLMAGHGSGRDGLMRLGA